MFDTIKKNGFKIDFYNGDFQYKDNSLCGWFAMFCCNVINKYNNLSISNAKKLIYSYFGNDADDNDIEVLINAFGLN